MPAWSILDVIPKWPMPPASIAKTAAMSVLVMAYKIIKITVPDIVNKKYFVALFLVMRIAIPAYPTAVARKNGPLIMSLSSISSSYVSTK